MPWEDVMETDSSALQTPISEEEIEARASTHQIGGLEHWDYDSPFSSVKVKIDDVDNSLSMRFVRVANSVLDNVVDCSAMGFRGCTQETPNPQPQET